MGLKATSSRIGNPVFTGAVTLSSGAYLSGIVAFEGVTSSFPALKRSTTQLHARLADDSAYASMRINQLLLNSGSFLTDIASGILSGYAADASTSFVLQFGERTAPSGVANAGRIFAQDNGAGKTQLMVIFGSGAAQQIAIEP